MVNFAFLPFSTMCILPPAGPDYLIQASATQEAYPTPLKMKALLPLLVYSPAPSSLVFRKAYLHPWEETGM